MRLAFVLVLVAALPACAPPRLGARFRPGGAHVGERLFWTTVTVEAHGAYTDDAVYVVSCPLSETGGVQADQCWWQPLGTPERGVPSRVRAGAPPSSSASPPAEGATHRRAAIEMASALHGCPRDRVEVQSDATREGVEGYWLLVCGVQRFMQWDAAQGRFVDRTPAQ